MLAPRLLLAVATAGSLALSVQTLDGEARTFPRDADAPRSIFVVSFTKVASKAASAWTEKLLGAQPSVFQVTILEDVPKAFRSMAVSGIARSVPAAMHARFWIATAGAAAWKGCTDAENLKEPHVFALDDRDRIVWRAHGEVSEERLQELKSLGRSTSSP
jgi:hypothetical protein